MPITCLLLILLGNASPSKIMEKCMGLIQSSAWPISKMNSSFWSNLVEHPDDTLLRLTDRGSYPKCLIRNSSLKVSAPSVTQSTCLVLFRRAWILWMYCAMLAPPPSPLIKNTGKWSRCIKMSNYHAVLLHSHHSTRMSLPSLGAIIAWVKPREPS